ncbi:MAG: transposase, partial [Isosphaeraceae bacterium]
MAVDQKYTRHLPHQIPAGLPIFLTWNLKGAMPGAAIEELRRERRRLDDQADRVGETGPQRRIRENKMIFAAADRFLDRAAEGPMHLKDPCAAKIVEDAILFGAGDRYDLFAWCIMSNHVHVLLKPHRELGKVTQGIKGYTARRVNELRGARGEALWQDESYDHWSRDEVEMFRIIDYIENNPVAARLCKCPEDWPWSSARYRSHWKAGQAFPPDADRIG